MTVPWNFHPEGIVTVKAFLFPSDGSLMISVWRLVFGLIPCAFPARGHINELKRMHATVR
jgi:hypothetical protein